MSINVSQSFHRTSSNAVDDTLTLTKAEMLAVNDNLMPSKYLTICQDDGFIYLYDKSATPNGTTGKFTKFEGGGGGVTDYDDLTDKPQIGGVTLSGNKSLSDLGITKSGLGLGSVVNTGDSATPTSGGTTKFTTGGAYTELAKKQDKLTASTNITIDSSNNISASMPTLGVINRSDIYSTTEKVVGCWTDGRPIYQKTTSINFLLVTWTTTQSGDVYCKYTHGISNISRAIDLKMSSFWSSTMYSCPSPNHDIRLDIDNTYYYIHAPSDAITDHEGWASGNTYLTVWYTKTTDAANSYNYSDENDYSTTEKIIGTWTNGAKLYQRTYTGTLPSNFCSTDYSSIGTYDVSFNSSYTVRAIEGSIHSSTYDVMLNDSWGVSPNISFLRVLKDAAKLQFQGNRTAFNSASYYLTVKYTK